MGGSRRLVVAQTNYKRPTVSDAAFTVTQDKGVRDSHEFAPLMNGFPIPSAG